MERTVWPPAESPELATAETDFYAGGYVVEQASVGIELAWNKPRQWYKPYLVVKVWRLKFTAGWLYW